MFRFLSECPVEYETHAIEARILWPKSLRLLKGFMGLDAPYEVPLSPQVECRPDMESLEESVAKVLMTFNANLGRVY